MDIMKRTGQSVVQEKPLPIREKGVVGYVRYSTKEQSKGFSKASQTKAIEEVCKNSDLLLKKVFIDSAISGTEKAIEEREAFFEMLQYCQDNDTKLVVVIDLSRLWRDDVVKIMVKKEFQKRNINLFSINQPQYRLGTTDPSEYLISSLFEAMATFTRMEIIQKLEYGRKTKLSKGGYSGGGMSLGLSSIGRKLVVDENEFEIVKEIFRLKRRGFTAYGIAKKLRDRGIKGKKGGTIQPATVVKVLKNKLYKGYLLYGRSLYPSELGKLI